MNFFVDHDYQLNLEKNGQVVVFLNLNLKATSPQNFKLKQDEHSAFGVIRDGASLSGTESMSRDGFLMS